MKRLANLGMTILAGLLACTLPAEQSSLSGHYRPDCAPYDGPAFIVVLPAPSLKSEFRLRANVPLQAAIGNWRHSGLSKPKDAEIALCRIGPDAKCDYPHSGSFRIAPSAAGKINGSFEARFSNGAAYQFNIVASPANGKAVRCG